MQATTGLRPPWLHPPTLGRSGNSRRQVCRIANHIGQGAELPESPLSRNRSTTSLDQKSCNDAIVIAGAAAERRGSG